MKRTLLALALIALAPQPASAIVLADNVPSFCSAEAQGVVQMPCAKQPVQLETMRTSMLRSLVPMNCRPVGVHFEVAGLPLTPGRAAGLIATAVVRAPSKNARLEQVCQPSHW